MDQQADCESIMSMGRFFHPVMEHVPRTILVWKHWWHPTASKGFPMAKLADIRTEQESCMALTSEGHILFDNQKVICVHFG